MELFGEHWQTAAIYCALLIFVILLFWSWHKNPHYENFCLLHAVANREGFYDPDRAHLTGSFLVTTFAVVACVIKGEVTAEVGMLIGGYASLWGAKSAWSYTVSKQSDVSVKREEIRRGRRTDAVPEESVEEEENRMRKERRGRLLE